MVGWSGVCPGSPVTALSPPPARWWGCSPPCLSHPPDLPQGTHASVPDESLWETLLARPPRGAPALRP